MTSRIDFLEFDDAPALRGDELVVSIPPGLTDTDKLLRELYEQGHLPGYFGFNWNALDECLTDFHWVEQHTVVIRHTDLPVLPALDLPTYLQVLADSVKSWKAGDDHALRVIFPTAVRAAVAALI